MGHHRWAVERILEARSSGQTILVPEVAVGETYTKLRYDRRVSPRRDSSFALTVFNLVAASPESFRLLANPRGAYSRARQLLGTYRDQSFSFVDAVIFLTIDDEPSIDEALTVDGRDFAAYRFARPVRVALP